MESHHHYHMRSTEQKLVFKLTRIFTSANSAEKRMQGSLRYSITKYTREEESPMFAGHAERCSRTIKVKQPSQNVRLFQEVSLAMLKARGRVGGAYLIGRREPLLGLSPVRISHSTTPKLKTSVFGDAGDPRSTCMRPSERSFMSTRSILPLHHTSASCLYPITLSDYALQERICIS